MEYTTEKKLLEQYIRDFDPDEFSSKATPCCFDTEEEMNLRRHLERFRARRARKKELEEKMRQVLESEAAKEQDNVIISQDQIDALLSKAGL